ncbi:hypothetical protein COCCADRAFT_80958 [Bipolaris zeicola 26-R-13]|uniref:Uncharacterized protein n=1 Tax=Cochliobolus carbonum (strain 26-R-13) TaxID=930089 RepID=W6YNQ3_COCC2|nr:uncharacterized protein COCCADRAFT_80958 [Bipolaris zeicola 26-R-13]EUC39235.1 hypothetical protein COCCADRAFT_80958 [Bipolaris zeicola 26-R-13]
MRPLRSQPWPVHRDGTTWPTADGSQTVTADSLGEILGVLLAVPPRGGCLQASLPHSSSRTRPLHGHRYPCRIPVKAVDMGPARCGLEATPLFSSSLSTCWVQSIRVALLEPSFLSPLRCPIRLPWSPGSVPDLSS